MRKWPRFLISISVLLPSSVFVLSEKSFATTGCESNGSITQENNNLTGLRVVKFTVGANQSNEADCTFVVPAGITRVRVLSVSGGGGGGWDGGGGGGGGGVNKYDDLAVAPSTSIDVRVGAGGAAGTSGSPNGGNGGDSKFGTNFASGGAGGGGKSTNGLSNGTGSGGGAGHTNNNSVERLGGSATQNAPNINFEFSGGNSIGNYGGGGGGAGAVGANATTSAGGSGGVGFYSLIDGNGQWFAGGGGGGTFATDPSASGGTGGGGSGGSNSSIAGSGEPNTGGGGGGGGRVNTGKNPGRGGSGIVIVAFKITNDPCTVSTSNVDGYTTQIYSTSGTQLSNCRTSWSTPSGVTTAQVLVVAGGGGGGGFAVGGGGGAGGYIYQSSFSVSGTITIQVGGGGKGGETHTTGATAYGNAGSNGSDSIFGSLTADGGGGGGAHYIWIDGKSGGSGGGGAVQISPTFGSGGGATASQGNVGAAGTWITNSNPGGGGGGSAGSGVIGTSSRGGNGGGGTSVPISGISINSVSITTVAAGGGGGTDAQTGGTGGSGIGGAGGARNSGGSSATANTGSGGGGSGGGSLVFGINGGNGSAGLVVLRYLNPPTIGTASISGTSKFSNTLTASVSATSGALTTLSYQWSSSSTQTGTYTSISGANSSSYLIAIADIGRWIRVTIQNQNASGTVSAVSTAVSIASGDAYNPILSSPTRTNDGFTFVISNYNSDYTWNTPTVTAGTVTAGTPSGSNRVLTVTGLAPGQSATLSQTTSRPGFSTGSVSATLSANLVVTYDANGGSSPVGGSTTTTTGGTISSLPTTGRSGYTFNGWFTAASGGTQITTSSAHNQTANFTLYAQWSGIPPNLSSVTVTGTALSGSVITATPSATGEGTITYSYQWYRIFSGLGTFQIDGAVNSTYTLTDSDLLGYVFVRVIASNDVASSSTVTGSMSPTPKVGVLTPIISGYLQSGQLLTGATSSSIPAGATSVYQWLRADSATGIYSAINGATNSTYRLTSSDVGKYLKFTITIREDYLGTSTASSSNATNVVINSYTISYAAGSGSGSGPASPTTVINGSTFTLPANTFTRAGYSFAGWSDGTNIYQAGDSYPAASGNVSLTATWTASSLTITYDSQGGSPISAGSTTTGGSIASSPGTPTRAGYTFNGWFIASTGGSAISFAYTHSQTANFTLYAQWTGDALTPTFDTPTATTDGFTVQISNYSDSYTYTGTASASGSVAISNTGLVTVTGVAANTLSVLTLTTTRAGFTSGTANVSLTSLASALTPVIDEVLTTNDGFTVSQKNYDSSFTYTFTLTNGALATMNVANGLITVTNLSVGTSSTITITTTRTNYQTGSATATGNPTPFKTVTFDANGGSGSMSSQLARSSTALTSNAFTRQYYSFLRWNTESNGTGTDYEDLATFDFSRNLSLFALWNPISLTVTYDSQGGTPVPNGATTYLGKIATAPTSPTRSGYTFLGWSATSSGSVITFEFAHDQNSNFTLYAQWSASSLTITYDSQGGSAISSGSTTTGGLIATSPGTPTRAGYTFNGWFTASTGGSAISFAYTHGQTANFTLYAQWSASSLTITYDSQGGSAISSGSTTTGGLIATSPGTPTRAGYTFNGWFTASTGGSAISFAYTHGQTANFKLYAQWSSTSTANEITFSTISSQSYGSVIDLSSYVSASSGLTVTLRSSTTAVCTVSSLSVTARATGTCTITASQSGNGSYVAATSVERSFTVGKKSLVITVGNLSAVVAGSVSDPSYSQSGLVTSFGDAIATPTYKYQGNGGTFYPISSSKPNKLGNYRISIDSIALTSGSILNYQVTFISGELTISGVNTNALSAISVKQASGDKTTELLNNFSDATTTYSIYVGADVSTVIANITRPTGSLITAQVKVNNSGWRKLTFQSNISNSGVLPLPSNVNSISIATAASDQSVRLFNITIYRDTKSAPTGSSTASPVPTVSPTPANQVVSAVRFYINNADGIGSGLAVVPMTPSFSRGTNSYTLSFTNLQSATIMKADFTGAGNTLRLKINSGPFTVIPNTGSSSTIALGVGTNIAILRVTSTESTTPEDYRFELTRATPTSALIPTLGSPTVSSTGFTVQITNYDNLFTWSAAATAGGSVAISSTGLITVSGLSPSTTSVLAVTSLRAGYANGRTTLTQITSSS